MTPRLASTGLKFGPLAGGRSEHSDASVDSVETRWVRIAVAELAFSARMFSAENTLRSLGIVDLCRESCRSCVLLELRKSLCGGARLPLLGINGSLHMCSLVHFFLVLSVDEVMHALDMRSLSAVHQSRIQVTVLFVGKIELVGTVENTRKRQVSWRTIICNHLLRSGPD